MHRGIFTGSVVAIVASATAAAPAYAGGREGDVMRVFDRSHVLVQTNEEPSVARRLIDGRAPRIFRVADLDAPIDGAQIVVRLENRLYSRGVDESGAQTVPGTQAVQIAARRLGRSGWSVTLSAPDGVHLRRAVETFRRLREMPARPLTETVRSVAVVPFGDAGAAAQTFLRRDGAHLLLPADYRAARRGGMDEILLIDRSATGDAETLSLLAMPRVGS
jgi:hypothetical protein